jgi:hypothetical protein
MGEPYRLSFERKLESRAEKRLGTAFEMGLERRSERRIERCPSYLRLCLRVAMRN